MATKAIPVTAAKVAATLSDYPAYIQPSTMTGWGALTLAEAQSLRFYSDEDLTTELAREVVSADEIHVKVPSLTTTTTIYADYDGIRADYATSATYGRNAVWSDYEWVFHGELSTGELVDSAGNVATTLRSAGATEETGPVGVGFDTNASSYWTIDSYSPFTNIGSGAFTFQTWHDMNTTTNRESVVYMGRDGTFNDVFYMQLQRTSDTYPNDILGTFREGTAGQIDTVSTTQVNGTQNLHHITRTGTTAEYFRNATSESTVTNAEVASTLGTTGDSVVSIAAAYTSGVQQAPNVIFDEMRFRGSVLSDNWITTEYNNQSDVGTFWGTVTDVATATFTPRVSMII